MRKKEGVCRDRKLEESGQVVDRSWRMYGQVDCWVQTVPSGTWKCLVLQKELVSWLKSALCSCQVKESFEKLLGEERCLLPPRSEIRKNLRSVRAQMRFQEFCPFPPHFFSRNSPSPLTGKCSWQDGISPPLGAFRSLAPSQVLAFQVDLPSLLAYHLHGSGKLRCVWEGEDTST